MTNSTHPEGQSKNSGPIDPVKKITGQILLFEAESAQYLALHKPKVPASLQRLNYLFLP